MKKLFTNKAVIAALVGLIFAVLGVYGIDLGAQTEAQIANSAGTLAETFAEETAEPALPREPNPDPGPASPDTAE